MRSIASRETVKMELGAIPGDFWIEMRKESMHGEARELRKLFRRYANAIEAQSSDEIEAAGSELIVSTVVTWNVCDGTDILPVSRETADRMTDADWATVIAAVCAHVIKQLGKPSEEETKN